MFPNSHAVYLHDTPGRHLFRNDIRAFSSGCIRVDQPFALAEHLLLKRQGFSEAPAARHGGGRRTHHPAQRDRCRCISPISPCRWMRAGRWCASPISTGMMPASAARFRSDCIRSLRDIMGTWAFFRHLLQARSPLRLWGGVAWHETGRVGGMIGPRRRSIGAGKRALTVALAGVALVLGARARRMPSRMAIPARSNSTCPYAGAPARDLPARWLL